MNVVTVIPARGGSKSIPLKNIQPLGGKPLIEYSIRYSLACPLVSRTVVSTDSERIAEVARACGADVPFLRPEKLAADDTQDFPVMEHALIELERLHGVRIDALILLRPTSPLRPSGLIERAIEILKREPDCDSIRAVVEATEHPYRQWVMEDRFMRGYESSVPEPYNLPRQRLPKTYFQSGDLEAVRRETLLAGSVSGRRVVPLLIDRSEMVDVDYEEDLIHAEKRLHERSNR